jgi:hypothetical protein
MSSKPPIAPLEPYFKVSAALTGAVWSVYDVVGVKIQDRKYIYHRGAFYADLADALELLIGTEPFASSEYVWNWWIAELRKRAEQLGSDATYAMLLPPPREDDWRKGGAITNQVDKILNFMLSVYAQEEDDQATSAVGTKITAAECVKICHRLAKYILPQYCFSIEKPTPEHPGVRVTWPWLVAVADELQKVYRAMGEPDVAGGWGPGGGAMPPVSWPGAK